MRTKRAIDPAELTRQLAEAGPPYEAAEAAAVLRICVSKLHDLARRGIIKAMRYPQVTKTFFAREELRRFLEQAQKPAAP